MSVSEPIAFGGGSLFVATSPHRVQTHQPKHRKDFTGENFGRRKHARDFIAARVRHPHQRQLAKNCGKRSGNREALR
jgi:hypothetical protein